MKKLLSGAFLMLILLGAFGSGYSSFGYDPGDPGMGSIELAADPGDPGMGSILLTASEGPAFMDPGDPGMG
ncbi:hypothetical protein [Halobacillus amylolyticus]|uniref:Phr family secreted Rap phosphatase inhibitor n=1 Tax=Halobacillus amylolyticus TaxID=2932259 RepID=A0ABY4H935_9BACI|nr:hypothetical protein [Halobacillus amylolyticus]UOR10455.1 hypothetical protein MUO15_12260 [Halobacillus amylolyticus]